MTCGVTISSTGSVAEIQVPAKTSDVLEWIRKKYKTTAIQFQGKIQNPLKETQWLAVFAAPCDDQDSANSHMLPSPFDEELYSGNIIILATESEDQDEYEPNVSEYTNLKASDYNALYQEWTFADNEEEDDEGIVAAADEDGEEEDEDGGEEEDEEDDVVRELVHARPVHSRSKNVFVDSAIRDKVLENFTELLEDAELARTLEDSVLHVISDQALKEGIEVDWGNRVFWSMYRNRAISIYENIMGTRGYVQNTEDWATKLKTGQITPRLFAEMTAVDMFPQRWKAAIERIIEKEKTLYTNKGTASIFMWCSRCKKKAKCDYYQLQTRSADEPMTTFVTCLECDRRWKF
uniref:TFIIS-type domain-containing protein n=1 Tax=viral metagenome TaxID=1070528 RepID=A0A6C0AI26_9ZZZZ